MKLYAPDYYNEFSCIADKCRHSCCIGWEIDVDDNTYEYYKSVDGEFGKRLKAGICEEDGMAHFVLTHDERCPFLNSKGLCDIILKLGENSLCQICDDHPRYRNFYADRTEIGLGLCCEAAAELILTRKNKAAVVEVENDGLIEIEDEAEQVFFSMRQELFDILQNREKTVSERVQHLLSEYSIKLPDKTLTEWADFYLSLERLDRKWTNCLEAVKKMGQLASDCFSGEIWEAAFEQLAVYFIYRHTAEGMYDGRTGKRIAFAVISMYMIAAVCAARVVSMEELVDVARMYSSEVEYCEDNIESLLEIL